MLSKFYEENSIIVFSLYRSLYCEFISLPIFFVRNNNRSSGILISLKEASRIFMIELYIHLCAINSEAPKTYYSYFVSVRLLSFYLHYYTYY